MFDSESPLDYEAELSREEMAFFIFKHGFIPCPDEQDQEDFVCLECNQEPILDWDDNRYVSACCNHSFARKISLYEMQFEYDFILPAFVLGDEDECVSMNAEILVKHLGPGVLYTNFLSFTLLSNKEQIIHVRNDSSATKTTLFSLGELFSQLSDPLKHRLYNIELNGKIYPGVGYAMLDYCLHPLGCDYHALVRGIEKS